MKFLNNVQQRVMARTSVCKECPHLLVNQKRCNLCGCFVVPKSAISGAKCPDDRWPDLIA